jgi:hypothetical protein
MKLQVLFLFSLIWSSTNAQVQMKFEFDTHIKQWICRKYRAANGAKIYYEEYGKGTVVTDSRNTVI